VGSSSEDFGKPSESGWWWAHASPGKRLAFAIVMLPIAAWLLYTLVTDPHRALAVDASALKAAYVASPLLVGFFAYQAVRAAREIRAARNDRDRNFVT
jgi:hypothetical protein